VPEDVDVDVEAGVARVEKRRPFVGRNLEKDELAALLREASRGQGGIVFIGGEPGVKTSSRDEINALLRAYMDAHKS